MTMVTTTTQADNLNKYMNKKTLENFRDKLYFYDMGEKSVWQDGAHTIQWLKFNKLNVTYTNAELDEGVTPTEQSFSASTVEITPKQFGEYVTLTDMLLDTDPVSYLDGAIDEISDNMARIVEDYIQATIDTQVTSNILFGGDASARSGLDSSDLLTAQDLNNARARLEANGVGKIGGSYVAIMHPLVYHDLLKDTDTGNFVEMAKYAAPEKLFKGEVGSIFGVRIVVSSNLKFYEDGGSSAVDAYPTYVIGKQAYGVPTLEKVTTYITDRQATDSDPLAQRIKVGAKVAFGCKVLQEDAIWKIETAASLGANT